jgi:endonuclease/exonuclease/phosphatase family metal-dependent hydrolase
VDIYDLHMDAGSADGDNEARIVGVEQLIDKINTFSAGQAVIVCGDFNMRYDNANDNINLMRLISSTGLTDSRIALGNTNELIDKILFRSNSAVHLTPVTYTVESDTFLDSKGKQLSDHEAVSVLFRWDNS